jgi:hypothetical protein
LILFHHQPLPSIIIIPFLVLFEILCEHNVLSEDAKSRKPPTRKKIRIKERKGA